MTSVRLGLCVHQQPSSMSSSTGMVMRRRARQWAGTVRVYRWTVLAAWWYHDVDRSCESRPWGTQWEALPSVGDASVCFLPIVFQGSTAILHALVLQWIGDQRECVAMMAR